MQQFDSLNLTAGPLSDEIQVMVLAHSTKPVVTAEMLNFLRIPFTIFRNPDWEWPPEHPELLVDRSILRPGLRGYALRQFRAFRGHQEILRIARPDKLTLVFEDDASPMQDTTPHEIIQQLNGAIGFLTEMGYDAVSFHARLQSSAASSIGLYGREYIELALEEQTGTGHRFFLEPASTGYDGRYTTHMYRWHEGCLCYMVNQAGREKWSAAGHGYGLPCDLFLANELNTIVMRNTIFLHNLRHGSVISNCGTAYRELNADGSIYERKKQKVVNHETANADHRGAGNG